VEAIWDFYEDYFYLYAWFTMSKFKEIQTITITSNDDENVV